MFLGSQNFPERHWIGGIWRIRRTNVAMVAVDSCSCSLWLKRWTNMGMLQRSMQTLRFSGYFFACFPIRSGFDAWLAQNGGSSNAYTAEVGSLTGDFLGQHLPERRGMNIYMSKLTRIYQPYLCFFWLGRFLTMYDPLCEPGMGQNMSKHIIPKLPKLIDSPL